MARALSRRGILRLGGLFVVAPCIASRLDVAQGRAQSDETTSGSELLFTAVVEDLPAPPAVIRLQRATIAAGGEIPTRAFNGPTFGVVERGVLALQVDGEAILSRAARGGDAAEALVPTPGTAVELAAGDQFAVPAGVGSSLLNESADPAAVLVVMILPATDDERTALPGASTPAAGEGQGVTTEELGEAVASGWPLAPFVVQLDRLDVGPGEMVPGFPGPVLLAVEAGSFSFALVDGEIQGTDALASPTTTEQSDRQFRVGPGQAIFFAGGINAITQDSTAAPLVLLRFGVAALPDEAGQEATVAASATPASAPASSSPRAAANETRQRVAAAGVRLRSTPSTAGAVVAELAEDVEVVIVGAAIEADGLRWMHVRVADEPDVEGFVAEQFLEPVR